MNRKKNKFMQDKLDFKINKEKRTVVCIASGCQFDLINDIISNISSENQYTKKIILRGLIDIDNDELLLKDKYIGIATCSPFDKFDEEYGKQLAIKKMRFKYNLAKYRKISKLCREYDKIWMVLDNMVSNAEEKTAKAEEYLHNCINKS